ncbi:TMhelix containing protein [Vibrio phage 1.170.O._10N.261.52.C3]|nr:TMhelix containing protein [Vibrio phage 1.170.O._10N.261.52.C3]
MLPALIPLVTTLLPEAVKFFTDDAGDKVVDKVSGFVKGVAGTDDMDAATKAIMADPDKALELKELLIQNKYKLDEMYLADKENARAMQKAALEQDDIFSKRFVYYFASAWSGFAMLYMAGITFVPYFTEVPAGIEATQSTILGFLLGTAVSGILQFFYGSTKGSKDKTTQSNNLINKLTNLGK